MNNCPVQCMYMSMNCVHSTSGIGAEVRVECGPQEDDSVTVTPINRDSLRFLNNPHYVDDISKKQHKPKVGLTLNQDIYGPVISADDTVTSLHLVKRDDPCTTARTRTYDDLRKGEKTDGSPHAASSRLPVHFFKSKLYDTALQCNCSKIIQGPVEGKYPPVGPKVCTVYRLETQARFYYANIGLYK